MNTELFNVDVILTFNTFKSHGTQEHFKLNFPIGTNEISAVDFIHRELFHRIVAKCRRLRRDPEQLIKISTCGSWKLFEDVTKQQGLDITHPCKWYFGDYRTDMDEWEKILVDEYRFGKKVLV